MQFTIDPEAYAEAEQAALAFLRDDCGRTGKLIVHRFHESDYGASQIVDVIAFSMLDKDAIHLEDNKNEVIETRSYQRARGGPRIGVRHGGSAAKVKG